MVSMSLALSKYLTARATLYQQIRTFFAERQVVEVDTPLLADAPVTDPFLEALTVEHPGKTQYLQTSPEYAMKQLLAAGSGDIYQLCKAFRAEEAGRLHRTEFTMLEWYRVGFDEHDLMAEVDALLQCTLSCQPATKHTYQSLFDTYLGINPHAVSEEALLAMVHQQLDLTADNLNRDDYLMLLFSHCIEPHLGHEQPVFVYDYPASQAALAQCKQVNRQIVAARFEVFVNGMELANGYHELTDATEQKHRFEKDLALREQLGLPAVPIDEGLVQALEKGLPACAGVALGVDRLLMLQCEANSLMPWL